MKQYHERLNTQQDSMFHIACTERWEQTQRESVTETEALETYIEASKAKRKHHSGDT